MNPQMGLMNMGNNPHEMAATAAAAQAMAAVQSRYALAVNRPRDNDTVRIKLLADCKSPEFADAARYSKPIGRSNVEGPSVRFVESALRAYGNVYREVSILFDAPNQRVVRVAITDLEANLTHDTQVVVQKTVERRRVRDGQNVISERKNTYGETVYVVEATDDEVNIKQAALVSKAIRELGLRILPAALVEEAQKVCIQTKVQGVSADPEQARKRMVDAFVSIGVYPDDLVKFLGHPIERSTPAEVAKLRTMHASIRDGEATWEDYIAIKDDADEVQEDAQEKAKSKKKGAERIMGMMGKPEIIDAKEA